MLASCLGSCQIRRGSCFERLYHPKSFQIDSASWDTPPACGLRRHCAAFHVAWDMLFALHSTRHDTKKGNATYIVSAMGPFPALVPWAIPLADGTLQLRLMTVRTTIVTLCYVNL